MAALKRINEGLVPTFGSLWENFFNDEGFFRGIINDFSTPAVNIHETDENYTVELAAPGMKKEDFKLEVDKNHLNISSEKETSEEEKEKNYTRKEYSYASFNRTFRLPENVNPEKIEAKYKEGILRISIPKVTPEVKKLKNIEIR